MDGYKLDNEDIKLYQCYLLILGYISENGGSSASVVEGALTELYKATKKEGKI